MKHTIILAGCLAILVLSCSKTGSGKNPSISLKSINTYVPNGGELDAIFNFNNSSSGLSGGSITVLVDELDQGPGINSLPDTIVNAIPAFANNPKGQFELILPANTFQYHPNEDDTLKMRFVANDANGNPSDTIASPIIIVQHS